MLRDHRAKTSREESAMLKLEGLSKHFGTTIAVRDVSLDIAPGQMVGIIGRSGAGKSTLLRLINRLLEPTRGTVYFQGVNITALRGRDLRAWRARCAMIFQQFHLVNRLDVLTNVLVGRLSYHWTFPSLLKHFSAAERALALQALQRLDILPQALQRAETLSGGQQQRVAIARALVQEPDLILADEPVASLDPHNARRVMDAIRTINREDSLTVLCNLHTLEIACAYCDRIVGMAQGQIVFDGSPAALTPDTLREIYGSVGCDTAPDHAIAPAGIPMPARHGVGLLPTIQ
jgi:phosphonate transport system ATP-binding protein